ncbi:MAG: response regulator transcription factor [Gammaproteobacteria bacterium]|nr:response regulator transcription factor [Gammaproteobacteria bacterium]
MVYVVDDDEAVRASVSLLLRSVGLEVYSYPSARALLDDALPAACACLVLDVRMPGMSGLELQRELAARRLDLPIVFITGHGDVPMAVAAMKAGAVDFLQKPFNDQDLIERVQQALLGAERTAAAAAEIDDVRTRMARLTPREHQVLARVVDGQANKTIAAALSLSERTVEIHRARAMEKMEARSLAELVRVTLLARE